VDKDSPEQIAAAVEEILADSGHTQEVVRHAQEMAMKKYDWSAIAHDMRNKVFGKVLAQDIEK
jgi:glycosyltransferase involved in cell wall biosynthesis